nr:family 2A encapsulin nanocompartment cargo protein cysteine desulfurase [uncultured Arsenicibacter sp.]
MSTSINTVAGLPDTAALEALANQLFAALPGEHPIAEGFARTAIHALDPALQVPPVPGAVLPAHISPPALGGVGISPVVGQSHDHGYTSPESAPFPQDSYRSGTVPASVAGSGASPSAIQHGNDINLENPRTSFPDENLKSGLIPASSGSVPLQQTHPAGLPYQDHGFETQLAAALQALYTDQPPAVPAPDNDRFYFLTGIPAVAGFAPQGLPFVSGEGHRPASSGSAPVLPFDANRIKADFPILQETVNGKPLIWLDNAATTQKPQAVIDRISYFYAHENSNIHRAAHELAARATDAYEAAREKVRAFINAASTNEIVFVRGATEAINLVAKSWRAQFLSPGDEIIVSHLEHHANIVPWQQLAQQKGVKLRVIPVNDHGELLLDEYVRLLSSRTKLVAFTQVSNALGTVTPAKQIIDLAHQAGARVLLDGAQSVSHLRVDVRHLDADFFVFSGHKVFGPTGIGVVYGKEELLNQIQPWQGGGNMIKDVTFERTIYHPAPARFEAGTGNIADAVGLGAAIDYVSAIGMDLIHQYEHQLLGYATNLLKDVPGLRLVGTASEKASVLSFTLKGYSNDEVGQALNKEGIAVRTGHHCAQPILRRLGLESTVRPSLAFYNTCADVDKLAEVLHKLQRNA